MRRVIGKYKDQDISMSALHLAGSYDGVLLGRRNDRWFNIERVNVAVDKESARLFGTHVPYYIADYKEIDYSKSLPAEAVYVYLECAASVKEGHGLHLILVWFQEAGQDPFAMAAERIKSVDWEKEARDFEY